jgi:DNA-binding transcriptional LysR family regulator
MDFSGLTLLVDILDSGNLSSAARKLKISRANVSYHLNQLEKSIGVQLVRRTTRRVEPTEIGMTLYRHGRTIRQELMAAQEAVSMRANRVRSNGNDALAHRVQAALPGHQPGIAV